MRTLMREFGVSLSTVMRAIERLTAWGLVERLHGKGVFVRRPSAADEATAPSPQVQFPARGSLDGLLLGVFCHEYPRDGTLQNACYDRLLRGAERAVHEGGGRSRLFVMPKVHHGDLAHIESLLDAFQPQAAVGVGGHWYGRDMGSVAHAMQRRHIPLVQLYSDSFPGLPVHLVAVDGARGIRLAVRLLVGLGHRCIGFLGHHGYGWSEERYRAAAAELGAVPPCLNVGDAELNDRTAAELVRLAGSCSAIVAANDRLSAWAVKALSARGFQVPGDVSVTGFDDDYGYRQVHLTTVGLPLEDLGAAAVALTASLLSSASSGAVSELRLEPCLLVRDTTGPARTVTSAAAPLIRVGVGAGLPPTYTQET
jgi:DNA-binding LacI/PurR family transcriptional regulator